MDHLLVLQCKDIVKYNFQNDKKPKKTLSQPRGRNNLQNTLNYFLNQLLYLLYK